MENHYAWHINGTPTSLMTTINQKKPPPFRMRAARRGVPMAPCSSASSLPLHTSPVQPHFHHPIVTSILQLGAGARGPALPSSPLKYKRAFIGRGEAGEVKHSRTARSCLKTVSSLMQQGKHQQQLEENMQLDYNKNALHTPEVLITHLQQAACKLIETTKMYFTTCNADVKTKELTG